MIDLRNKTIWMEFRLWYFCPVLKYVSSTKWPKMPLLGSLSYFSHFFCILSPCDVVKGLYFTRFWVWLTLIVKIFLWAKRVEIVGPKLVVNKFYFCHLFILNWRTENFNKSEYIYIYIWGKILALTKFPTLYHYIFSFIIHKTKSYLFN